MTELHAIPVIHRTVSTGNFKVSKTDQRRGEPDVIDKVGLRQMIRSYHNVAPSRRANYYSPKFIEPANE